MSAISGRRPKAAQFRKSPMVLAISAAFLPAAVLPASNPFVPIGEEQHVNKTRAGFQGTPSVAMDADGDYIVVWEGYDQTTLSFDIFAQRFSATGQPKGGETRINTNTAGDQGRPAVSMSPGGSYVVVWNDDNDGDGFGVEGRRFTAAGTALGPEFQVNSMTTGEQFAASVAMNASGGFVVGFEAESFDGDLYAAAVRVYDSAGVALGDQIRVNETAAGDQFGVDVAMDEDGDFVVVFTSDGAASYDVYARRYNELGEPQDGAEFLVNTYTTDIQEAPAVAMDAAGNFVVVWVDVLPDGFYSKIMNQRYLTNGTAVGTNYRASELSNEEGLANQGLRFPDVAMDSQGNAFVVWQAEEYEDFSVENIAGLRIDNQTFVQAGTLDINTYRNGFQGRPTVAMDADGDAVVAWESFAQERNGTTGVYMQRYTGIENVGLSVSMSDSLATVVAEGAYNYIIGVTNGHAASATNGFGVARGLQAVLKPPVGSFVVGASGTNWDCQFVGYTLACDYLVGLAPTEIAPALTVEMDAPRKAGPAKAQVSVEANQFDEGDNNTDTETTTVVAADTTPGTFTFVDKTGQLPNKVISSAAVTISGINAPAEVLIQGDYTAQYKIGTGAWQSGRGFVNNGQKVTLRVTSSNQSATTVGVTVTIGGVSDMWTVKTQ